MIKITDKRVLDPPKADEQLLIQTSPVTGKKGNIFFRHRNSWESIWQYIVNAISKSSTLKIKWKGDDLEFTIKSSGVNSGSYTEANITVSSDGRITSASNGAKTSIIAGNESSTTLYANVKGVVDWVKQGMTALLSSLSLTKTTPVDADSLLLNDSADSNKLKLLTWANLKATLKTYFDGIYSNKNIKIYTVENTVQGTSTETIVASFDVSNWFKAGDGFEASTFNTKSAQTAGDTWGVRFFINSSLSLSGAVELFDSGGIGNTIRTSSLYRQAFTIKNNTTIYGFVPVASGAADYVNATGAMQTFTVPDITGTLYFMVALRHTTATNTDTLTHRKTVLRKQES